MKRTYLKFCSFALALVMVLAAFAGTFTFTATAVEPSIGSTHNSVPATSWADNYDTTVKTALAGLSAGDTYDISTAAGLAALAAHVNANGKSFDNNGNLTDDCLYGVTIYITDDIDLGAHKWIEIGTSTSKYFAGSIIGKVPDGNGYRAATISNMKISATSNNTAFVGNHCSGVIENLKFDNAYVTASGLTTASIKTIGIVVGYSRNNATTTGYPTIGYNDIQITNSTVILSDSASESCAPFANVNWATQYTNRSMDNITVQNVYVSGSGKNTGAILGTGANVPMSNCSVENTKVVSTWKTSAVSVTLEDDGTTVKSMDRYSWKNSGTYDAKLGGIAGNFTGTMTNCTSDAALLYDGGVYAQTIGGLVGAGGGAVAFTNCTFSGTIDTNGETGGSVGGFIGYQNSYSAEVDFANCIMTGTIDFSADPQFNENDLKAEYVEAYKKLNTSADDTAAAAALKTWLDANKFASYVAFAQAKLKLSNGIGGFAGQFDQQEMKFENCYMGGKVLTNYERRVGGFVGFYRLGEGWGNQGTEVVTFIDCQMDGVVDGKSTQVGAFIGRANGNPGTTKSTATVESDSSIDHQEAEGIYTDTIVNGTTQNVYETDADDLTLGTATLNFTRCLMTGVVGQGYGINKSHAWIGSAAGFTGQASYLKVNHEDCYSNSKMPFVGNTDSGVMATYVSVNSSNWVFSSSDSVNVVHKPTQLSEESLTELNNGGTLWQQAEGETPVLTVAATANVARPYATADMSWFDPTNYQNGFTISTNAQYLGLAVLSHLNKYSTVAYNYVIADSVNTAAYAEKFADGFLTAIDPFIVDGHAEAGDLTLKFQVPTTDNKESESTKLRLVSAIDAADIEKYSEVGFVITMGGKTIWLDTTKVFATINGTANGMACEYTAENFDKTAEDYLFTQVITDIPNSVYKTGLTIRVYAVETDGDVIMGNVYYNVTLNSLLPDAPVEE